jgi:DNA polymerase theta
MLEVVASGIVSTPAHVEQYVRCTLLAHTRRFGDVAAATKAALCWLGDRSQGMVLWDAVQNVFRPTPFGKAALAAGVAPGDAMHIRADLSRAREAFVLTTELHLAYLCVPVNDLVIPNRHAMLAAMGGLGAGEASVAAKVGIDMAYVVSQARGTVIVKTENALREGSCSISEQERVCRRFWAALVLADLLQEVRSFSSAW